MSRIGHKYVSTNDGQCLTGVDATVEQFSATMGYKAVLGYESPDAFLQRNAGAPWLHETADAMASLLRPGKRILSVGSGVGEQEVLLLRKGLDVTASDIIPGVLDRTAALFPTLKIRTLDIRSGELKKGEYDDILDTGISSYYDDWGLQGIAKAVHRALPDDGRFVAVLRYRDTPVSWCIDNIVLPVEAAAKNAIYTLLGRVTRWRRKEHGHRRSIGEFQRIVESAGFASEAVRYGGYAMEFNRSSVLMRIPGFFTAAHKLDRLLHVCNAATVFEFRRLGVWLAGLLIVGIDMVSLLFEMDAMGVLVAVPL